MPVLWGSAETNFGTFARLARFTIRVFQLLLKYAQTIERVMQQLLFVRFRTAARGAGGRFDAVQDGMVSTGNFPAENVRVGLHEGKPVELLPIRTLRHANDVHEFSEEYRGRNRRAQYGEESWACLSYQ